MLVLSEAVLVIDRLGWPLDYDYERDQERDWKYEYDYAQEHDRS